MTDTNSINRINSVSRIDSVNDCIKPISRVDSANDDNDFTRKVVIIKAGALFSISSRAGVNNDLTLDDSIYVKLYKNAVVNISGTSYIYGPVGMVDLINSINPSSTNNVIVLSKGSKYHVNNVNIDPIGLTTIFACEQKVCMNPCCPIILPSGTVLHTLDRVMEFTLTKAVHCILA